MMEFVSWDDDIPNMMGKISFSLWVNQRFLWPFSSGCHFPWGYNGIYPLVVTNSLPWKDPPMFKNCKSSISMGHCPEQTVSLPEGTHFVVILSCYIIS